MSPILDQRIAARDWSNIAKMLGCSVHSVRMKHDDAYRQTSLGEAPQPIEPPKTRLRMLKDRMRAIKLSEAALAVAANTNKDFLRLVLTDRSNLSRSYFDRLMLAMDIVEQQKMRRAA